ncbi:hypothetical protein BJX66DRAFT_303155 [Aspergillus keveii]|uniref:Uncharacterized protein n=1 Tax=Aspergillus keveii TaxID=714993 RepID=A0ABR4G6Y3_9EURO
MKNQPAAKQQYMYDRDAIKSWSLVWAKQSAYRNVGLRDGADPRTPYGQEAPPSSIVHASLCRKCQHKSAPDPDIADSWWEVRLRRIGHRKLVSARNASAYWRQTGWICTICCLQTPTPDLDPPPALICILSTLVCVSVHPKWLDSFASSIWFRRSS